MTKKNRSDSVDEQARIMLEALQGIKPPPHAKFSEEELYFWKNITDTKTEWTAVDLNHAVMLARTWASMEANNKALKEEGDVVRNQRGTQIMNPRFTILEQLSKRSISIASKIQVHAAATTGESKLGRGKNAEKQRALKAFADQKANNEDDLIARPVH